MVEEVGYEWSGDSRSQNPQGQFHHGPPAVLLSSETDSYLLHEMCSPGHRRKISLLIYAIVHHPVLVFISRVGK